METKDKMVRFLAVGLLFLVVELFSSEAFPWGFATHANPNDSDSKFVKLITRGQWMAICRLVKNVSGSTIYWNVESWDGLNRHTRTEVMNLVLTD